MSEYRDRTGDLPTLSLEERDRRWSAVRESMYQRNIDCLLVWSLDHRRGMGRSNLRYLTHIPGQINAIGLFPLEGDPVVFSDAPHFHEPYNLYKVYQNWVEDSRLLEGVNSVVEEVKDRGFDEGRIGIAESGKLLSDHMVPQAHMQTIEKGLPEVELVDATDIFVRARLIKSDEEIEMLRRAGEIAHEMALDMLNAEPGMTEAELFADMHHTQIAEGSEAHIFNLMDSGSPTDPRFQHLLHGKRKPLAPTQRTLEDGDLVISEYHAGYGGYLAAVEKSVVLGSAPDELKDIHEVCIQCFENGLEKFTPGTRCQDLWEAIRAPAEEAGMDYVELGFHGHGMGSPEFPSAVYPQEGTHTYPNGLDWHPISGSGAEDVRLREGMVFGTNIDVYDPNWREDVGLMFGDTILVTENGPEKLVDLPYQLVV